ncbi:MAG: cell wall metabolism sensor histidine kinase WalK [Gemmataceae bacterium]|nr:cell wall metabolism sensor histidine kinase WalK [Gemmataceae bacterium]
MFRSRMLWQLFVAYGVLIVVAVGLLGYLIASQVERNELAEIDARLRNQAYLLREVIRGRDFTKDEHWLPELAKVVPEFPLRVTYIAENGKVLADSSRNEDELDNHGLRPEIVEALRVGEGKSVRFSNSVNKEMMYFALRTNLSNSPAAVVRVSLPLEGVYSKVAGVRRLVWPAVGLTAAVALLVGFWLARRITRPLQELSASAEQIAAGAFGNKVYSEGVDEVGKLARTFNHMSEHLAGQFAQLDEDRQQLRTVLSSMEEGVVAIDANERVLVANDRAGQLLEFSNRTALGRPLWEIVRQRPVLEIVRYAMVDSERPCPELNWEGPLGRSLSVHVAKLPGAHPRGAVLVFRDNTELRRLERLRREFVANVSHELKTPLAIIQACVETLIDGAVDDPSVRGQFLERIADQAHRLHNLIIDLLRLARIESETEAFTKEALDLEVIVRECLEKHRTLAEGKRQRLESAPPPGDAPAVAWADEEAVQQILDNLVDNALKYTPEGGLVRVRWGREKDQVFLEISDSGIGIAEHDLSRIFERFYRVDKARSREMGGTGLGLSIVKHLAQAMQGSVKATSQLNKGSTFSVFLPTALATPVTAS